MELSGVQRTRVGEEACLVVAVSPEDALSRVPRWIKARWDFSEEDKLDLTAASAVVCNIKAETQDLVALKGDIDSYSMVMDFVMMGRPEDPQYLITGGSGARNSEAYRALRRQMHVPSNSLTPETPYPTPCTLHPTPYTPHPTL